MPITVEVLRFQPSRIPLDAPVSMRDNSPPYGNPMNRTAEDIESTSPPSVATVGPGSAAVGKVFAELGGRTMPSGIRNVREGSPFELRGYVATVDLRQTKVLVSSNRNHPLKPGKPPDQSLPQRMSTTEDWANYNGTDLAINANFFNIVGGDVHSQIWTATDGLSLSDYIVDHPSSQGQDNGKGVTSLLFRDDNNQARIIDNYQSDVNLQPKLVSRSTSALNIPERYKYGVAGNRLLKDGATSRNLGPDPQMRHARMAVGIKDDGFTLAILMFELQTELLRPEEYKLFGVSDPNRLRQIIDSMPVHPNEDRIKPALWAFLGEHPMDIQMPSGSGPLTTVAPLDQFNNKWTVTLGGEKYTLRKLNNKQGIPELMVFANFAKPRTKGSHLSVGVTLEEMARVMLELGVADAVNLDGSGSSSFVYTPHSKGVAQWISNAYHDWTALKVTDRPTTTGEMYSLEDYLNPRPSGNHLGFKE
jgi:Phosphodiester glycosidase